MCRLVGGCAAVNQPVIDDWNYYNAAADTNEPGEQSRRGAGCETKPNEPNGVHRGASQDSCSIEFALRMVRLQQRFPAWRTWGLSRGTHVTPVTPANCARGKSRVNRAKALSARPALRYCSCTRQPSRHAGD